MSEIYVRKRNGELKFAEKQQEMPDCCATCGYHALRMAEKKYANGKDRRPPKTNFTLSDRRRWRDHEPQDVCRAQSYRSRGTFISHDLAQKRRPHYCPLVEIENPDDSGEI
ncbi:hypothetical protein FWF74_02080 [Candidatus Saccharibacteria bacterium]|nr:hypothetical protein [Candidatus Saccharibacteria bacterium]MCL1963394.1 hypothetical protein [Candidatus Saccharibacteria bacterium]